VVDHSRRLTRFTFGCNCDFEKSVWQNRAIVDAPTLAIAANHSIENAHGFKRISFRYSAKLFGNGVNWLR